MFSDELDCDAMPFAVKQVKEAKLTHMQAILWVTSHLFVLY
ncbi:MAG: hypothetical protein HZLCBSQH_000672 [Candidatus Fervidibacterota bacterium]